MNWNKMVKMTVPVGLCGWQQRGSLTINGRTTEFQVGVETELPEPVAERIKALIDDAEGKAEHVQTLKPWQQFVTGEDGVAHWSDRIDKPGSPHQYLTTDGNGKPHWEDKLAYAETEEVVILPETKVEWEYPDSAEALLKTPFQKRMEGGHEYTVMWNGQPHKCAAQEVDDGEGGVAVTVEAEGYFMIIQPPEQVTASYGVSAFVLRQDEITSATFSITAMAETVKTIDPKYLPSGSGGGGVMYIAGTDSLIVPAYADDALTTMLSYDQAKEIIQKPFAVFMNLEGLRGAMYPVMAAGNDSEKVVQMIIVTPEGGAATGMTLTFSDTPES